MERQKKWLISGKNIRLWSKEQFEFEYIILHVNKIEYLSDKWPIVTQLQTLVKGQSRMGPPAPSGRGGMPGVLSVAWTLCKISLSNS